MKNKQDQIRQSVQRHYAARVDSAGCCSESGGQSSCCGEVDIHTYGQAIGYAIKELALLPDGANLGLGCGNPTAFADVKPGETILDLGSGGGMDAFIAARLVGEHGRVIGVDMTPEMIDLARKNAAKANYTQVEFRLGLIEDLPVEDAVVDLVISNCVVNLSTDKSKVYQEVYRVLKPGGRIAISDPVRVAEFPEAIKEAEDAYAGCIAGAVSIDELKNYLGEAGFEQIQIVPKGADDAVINGWVDEDLEITLGQYVVSMLISAVKPQV
jgi:arsenite methyltransferase